MTTTKKHFEHLWEESENFYNSEIQSASPLAILDEINLKINLYKTICLQENLAQDQRDKLKNNIFGEILMTLTQLSLKDNINAYAALKAALGYKKIQEYNLKY